MTEAEQQDILVELGQALIKTGEAIGHFGIGAISGDDRYLLRQMKARRDDTQLLEQVEARRQNRETMDD